MSNPIIVSIYQLVLLIFQSEARLSCTTPAPPSPWRPRSPAPSARSASATRNPQQEELSEHTPASPLMSKFCLSAFLFLFLSISPSHHISISLSRCFSVSLSLHLCFLLTFLLSISMYLCLYVSPSHHISISVSLYFKCLCPFVSTFHTTKGVQICWHHIIIIM